MEINKTLTGVSVADNFGLIIANKINLINGDLRLIGEAQLIQTHLGIDANIVGTGKLLRDQQGISTNKGYNFWSSPVNAGGTFKLNGGLFYGTDPFLPTQFGFTTGLNGSIGTISERWLYKYSLKASGYDGWDKIDKDSAISPGEGFSMKGTGEINQNYIFKGTPNNGEYIFSSVVSGQSILLGNPYPSALDISLFISQNNSVNQIEIWVDGGTDSHYLSSYLGGYAIVNSTTGVLPSTPESLIAGLGDFTGLPLPTVYLPVAQGFFVEAINSDDIVFNNSQRVFKTEVSGDSFFYKTSKVKDEKTIQDLDLRSMIRIGYENPEKFHRQLALGFIPNSSADLNFNRGYDAFMSEPREDELFYIIENDLTKKYVIQGVGAFNDTYEFPLGLIIKNEGEHSIMIDGVENFDMKVYLKDVVLDTIYNLSDAKFFPNLPAGEYLDRFRLVFKPKEEIVIIDDVVLEKNINVYYNKNNNIIIKNQSEYKLNNVFIFNMLGQKLVQVNSNLLSQTEISIPFNYVKGMYVILIDSELGKKSYKIVN